MGGGDGVFIDIHRYDLAKTLIISVEMLIQGDQKRLSIIN